MNNCCNLELSIKNIIKNDYKYFMQKQNVIGLGRGYKIKNSFLTNHQCLIVFVSKKLPLNQISQTNVIPIVYNGVCTDVIQCDVPVACSLTNKIRPVTGGYAVGVKEFEPGCMGCLVANSRHDYILTSAHNIVGTNASELNITNVLQPPPKYGGKSPRDNVGDVSDYIRAIHGSTSNYIEAATIITTRDMADPAITFLGLVRGSNKAKLGESVKKVGAISGLTTGNITALDATIRVDILGKDFTFKEQIVTTKMSVQGDSGALLVNKNMEGLGLLMANSRINTVYNDINLIMERFNVYIVRR